MNFTNAEIEMISDLLTQELEALEREDSSDRGPQELRSRIEKLLKRIESEGAK